MAPTVWSGCRNLVYCPAPSLFPYPCTIIKSKIKKAPPSRVSWLVFVRCRSNTPLCSGPGVCSSCYFSRLFPPVPSSAQPSCVCHGKKCNQSVCTHMENQNRPLHKLFVLSMVTLHFERKISIQAAFTAKAFVLNFLSIDAFIKHYLDEKLPLSHVLFYSFWSISPPCRY